MYHVSSFCLIKVSGKASKSLSFKGQDKHAACVPRILRMQVLGLVLPSDYVTDLVQFLNVNKPAS